MENFVEKIGLLPRFCPMKLWLLGLFALVILRLAGCASVSTETYGSTGNPETG
jgi:hypothetical protein